MAAGPPPIITVQPLDQTVLNGDTAIFTVVATSGTTLSYQWYENVLSFLNKKLTGQTSSTLTLNNVSSWDEGEYYVEVKNAAGKVTSRKATLTIDTAPVANNNTYTILEDAPLIVPAAGILGNDTDADGDALTAVLVNNVTHGSLSLSTNGGFTYTPNPNYNGSDSFTYRAHDGLTTGNVATVTINITPVNDPPVPVNDRTNTLEDVSVTIKVLANDSDVEGTPLAITGTSTTNGTAVISGTNIVFTPSTNFNGTVVFNYTVSDGTNSATANVSVTVTSVNDASPVANNDTYTTLEDLPLTVSAPGILHNDTDVDGDALTAMLVSNVSNGSLSLNTDGSFTYTPNTNYNGSDSFTYRVSDGLNAVVAILEQNTSGGNKIEVRRGKDGAQSFRHGTAGGTSYTISKIVLYVSREPALPAANPAFSIGTGINSGAMAGSSVTIPASSITNTTSGASFQTYEIAYSTPVGPFTAGTTYYLNLDNPTDKRFFVETYNSDSYPNGTYYDDGSNQNEDMRFQVFGSPLSDIATVTLTVTPVNDAPLANNDSTNTLEDVSVTIKVLANDSDPEGTPLTLTDTSTTNGTAVISGTNIVFTPSTNFNGTVVFNYTVSDGTNSATANVTVTVTSVNDAPMANNDTYTTPEDVPLTIPAPGILLNDTDVDGDALSALLVSDISHGSLSLNPDGSFTYTPTSGYVGNDSFSYRARDASATSAVATVTITILDNTPLSFSSAEMTADGFSFRLSGPPASTYVIMASTDMVNWTPISTNAAPAGTVDFTDTAASNYSFRYYRAMMQ